MDILAIQMEPSNSSNSSGVIAGVSSYEGFDEDTKKEVRNFANAFVKEHFEHSPLNSTASSSPTEGVNPVGLKETDPGYDSKLDPNSSDFSSEEWIRNLATIVESDPEYYKPHRVGCCWKNLSAVGDSSDLTYQTTFGNLPFKIFSLVYRHMRPSKNSDTFQILKPMDGCVDPGEMLVVLGRPGSGCTTLLKSISCNSHGFDVHKDSIINYNGMPGKEIRKTFRGEVMYNAESDMHIPNITVYQTLVTVARLKTPSNRIKGVDRESWAEHMAEVAMATYGLLHTRNTKVGNDLIRGVWWRKKTCVDCRSHYMWGKGPVLGQCDKRFRLRHCT